MATGLTHDGLQKKARDAWHTLPSGLRLRMRRAMSWIERAEKETDDQDAAFIFYWIAFNALYGQDTSDVSETTERTVFNDYFDKIICLEANHEIYDAIWQRFSGPIRNFMNNEYVYQPFWKHQNQVQGYEDWEIWFSREKSSLMGALARQDTKAILKSALQPALRPPEPTASRRRDMARLGKSRPSAERGEDNRFPSADLHRPDDEEPAGPLGASALPAREQSR